MQVVATIVHIYFHSLRQDHNISYQQDLNDGKLRLIHYIDSKLNISTNYILTAIRAEYAYLNTEMYSNSIKKYGICEGLTKYPAKSIKGITTKGIIVIATYLSENKLPITRP